ncbi:unannotated protein [freshwater metagenome]|uniref:Unannotated protein n=1 Tax=freshwater metagenome TaxID=449393 RepID=A0A6J6YIM1_9ZZZZ
MRLAHRGGHEDADLAGVDTGLLDRGFAGHRCGVGKRDVLTPPTALLDSGDTGQQTGPHTVAVIRLGELFIEPIGGDDHRSFDRCDAQHPTVLVTEHRVSGHVRLPVVVASRLSACVPFRLTKGAHNRPPARSRLLGRIRPKSASGKDPSRNPELDLSRTAALCAGRSAFLLSRACRLDHTAEAGDNVVEVRVGCRDPHDELVDVIVRGA